MTSRIKRSRREIGKTNQRIGKRGEQVANSVLHGLGIECLEKIATPALYVPYVDRGMGRIVPGVFRVVFEEKVAGDRHGLLPDGTGVLAEVKTIADRPLSYGDLEDHQHSGLLNWSKMGGLALIVWVHHSVYVMRYPIEGFEKGKPIHPERAQGIHDYTVKYLSKRIYG